MPAKCLSFLIVSANKPRFFINRMKLLLNISIAFLFTSCLLIKSKLLTTEMSNKNKNVVSFSDTLHIYKTHRSFFYDVIQKIDTDTLYFRLQIRVIPNAKIKGAVIEYVYLYPQEYVKKYKLCDSVSFKNCNIETTTILEKKDFIFLHPPRSFTLRILQLTPFPMLYTNRKHWGAILKIPRKSWGKWAHSSTKFSYTLDSMHISQNNVPEKYVISCHSTSKFGTSEGKFSFQVDSGITSLEYKYNLDDTTGFVIMNLRKIIN